MPTAHTQVIDPAKLKAEYDVILAGHHGHKIDFFMQIELTGNKFILRGFFQLDDKSHDIFLSTSITNTNDDSITPTNPFLLGSIYLKNNELGSLLGMTHIVKFKPKIETTTTTPIIDILFFVSDTPLLLASNFFPSPPAPGTY